MYMKKIIWTFLSIFMLLIGFTSCSKDDDGPATVSVTGITLDQSVLNISKGETVRLKATVTPSHATNQTVTWRTLNNLVAAVDQDGSVTATGGGTTEIFAKTEDGQFLASCTVNVVVNVASITLSESEISIKKGESKTITATVHPDDATEKGLTWSTNNPNIATVENGVIRAINGGSAIITVASPNGDVKTTCFVKVTVPVQSITISKEQLELVVGQKYRLTTTILPDDASNKNVKWSTSNDGVVSVDNNGHVTAKKPGTAVVTATTEDGYHSASCTITVRKAQNIGYNPYGDGQKW